MTIDSNGRLTVATPISPSTRTVGFWSAVLATVFSVSHIVGRSWPNGWDRSARREGQRVSARPLGLQYCLLPHCCWALHFSYLLSASTKWRRPRQKSGAKQPLHFATAYAVLISLVYFVQLTLVAPRLAHGPFASGSRGSNPAMPRSSSLQLCRRIDGNVY
jgi:hypothetical protein